MKKTIYVKIGGATSSRKLSVDTEVKEIELRKLIKKEFLNDKKLSHIILNSLQPEKAERRILWIF